MNTYRIMQGDVIEQLRTLPDNSVQCVVTSPPYWGLRDYGTATWEGGDAGCDHKADRSGGIDSSTLGGGKKTTNHQQEGYRTTCPKCGAVRIDNQIGLEPTPQEYVARLVAVFDEVRRVLRDDGTLWLNLGDSYAAQRGGTAMPAETLAGGNHGTMPDGARVNRDRHDGYSPSRNASAIGLKHKDLCGIPWRVAFALQDANWWLRAEIVWHKTAPMPESVTDRPTRSHEQIFLLTKRSRYFYDAEAVREDAVTDGDRRFERTDNTQQFGRNGDDSRKRTGTPTSGRNQRDVWTLGPEPYAEAHFATFPTEIPRRAIRAGTSERGCCPACGAPWKRVVEREGETPRQRKTRLGESDYAKAQPNGNSQGLDHAGGHGSGIRRSTTTGWTPTCECDAGDPVPCTVLDPFGGSGTTAAVAIEQFRNAIIIELNPDYVELARRRIAAVAPLLSAEIGT